MNQSTALQATRFHRTGFSLPELLVVITIMTIMASVGMFIFKDTGGNDLRAAVSVSAQMFESARNLAVTRGKRTRVGINTLNDPLTHLRDMAIFMESRNEDDEPGWELIGEPVKLPSGIRMDLSAGDYREEVMVNERRNTFYSYVIFEFTPVGTTPDSGTPFVLARAFVEEPLRVVIPNKERRSGFILRRSGRITFYQDAEQIRSTPESSTNNVLR